MVTLLPPSITKSFSRRISMDCDKIIPDIKFVQIEWSVVHIYANQKLSIDKKKISIIIFND